LKWSVANYKQTAPPSDHPQRTNFLRISFSLNLDFIKLWISIVRSLTLSIELCLNYENPSPFKSNAIILIFLSWSLFYNSAISLCQCLDDVIFPCTNIKIWSYSDSLSWWESV
jgi:hypothetical protein